MSTLIKKTNLGDKVYCDMSCGEEFTDSDAVGGFTFGSKAVCPNCAPGVEATAKKFGEESYIGQRAAPGQTFRDFVVNTLREGQPGSIEVYEL